LASLTAEDKQSSNNSVDLQQPFSKARLDSDTTNARFALAKCFQKMLSSNRCESCNGSDD